MNRKEELYRALDQRMHEAEGIRRRFGERSKEHAEAELAVLAARREYEAAPKRINPHGLFVGAFVPNWLFRFRSLSPSAKLAYAKLCQYAGKAGVAYPKLKTLAEALDIGARQLRRCLTELEKHRLIDTENLGLGRANRYFFLEHPEMSKMSDDESEMSTPEWTGMTTPERSQTTTPINKERRESIEENQKKKFDPLQSSLPYCLESPEGRAAWGDWVNHRNETGRPLTATAARLQLKELERCLDPIAVLERATAGQWMGLNIRDEDRRPQRPPLHQGDATR